MNLMKTSRALAAMALATLGFAFPAEATVTFNWSAGATCGNPPTASFSPGGATFQATLCASTTTERGCGFTAVLQANTAGESNAFSVTARNIGTAYVDPTVAFPPFPLLIANPPTVVDLGSTSNAAGPPPAPVSASPGANQLLATYTFAPQASATNATYLINLAPVSEFDIDQGDVTCASSTNSLAALPVLTLNLSQAPAITSANSTTFTAGTLGTFNVTASGSPASTFTVTAGTLPAGISLSPAGVLSGTATATGVSTFTITATNGVAPAGTQSFTLTVVGGSQTITFANPGTRTFSSTPIASAATASSGLTVVLTSATTPVCTITGLNINMITAGTCTINANQPGNGAIAPAPQVVQTFTITAVAPAAPTIGAGTPGNNTATVAFTAPANNGGSVILDYTATCTGTPTGTVTGATSPLTVTGLVNGNSYVCSVVARNAVGTGPASATVSVTPAPGPPAFTSVAATTFTVGVAGTYTVTATNSPTFTSTALPAGITLTSAGVLAGTPSTAGVFPITITATGTPPAATQAFMLTINKGSQTITFGAISNQPFNASPIALTGTATSGLAVAYTSTTLGVCTISGASAAFLSAGTCTIVASQPGDANFNAAAPNVTQTFTVTASAPGAPTIGLAQPANLQAFIGFTPPTVTGGSPIIDYTATCTGGTGGTATGTTSPLNVTGLVNGTTYTCSVTARNVTGSSPASATATVTPAPIVPPGPPVIGGAIGGNTQATITFTPPTVTGGSAITGYTATCNPGAIAASGAGSPVTVTGLTNNTTYTCSVQARNIAGLGLASATVSVTPRSVPIVLGSTSSVANYGAPLTLVASVTGNNQTGTVAFSVNTANGPVILAGCAAVPLVVGQAMCNAPGSFQNQNPRLYLATYSGDGANAPASTSLAQVVALTTAVLSVSSNPLQPVVTGRSTVITALIKMNSPVGTVSFFDNGVAVTGCAQTPIAILPDATDSAVATCVLPAPAAGTKQYVVTYFYPAGHVSGRVFEQANFDLRATATGPVDYTDMWWAGVAENGWGISIAQHGPIQFNVIFAYDNLGKPLWYVMPGGSFNAAGTVFSGPLFLSTSSPFSAYNAAQFVIGASVGNATITYTSNSTATLAYTISGVSGTKSIQRQIFASATTGPNLLVNDIWWATFAENGWGMNIAQQGRVLFPVWYTYGADGKATFFTGQGGSWNGTVWSASVFTHASSAWLGVPYSPALFTSTKVGTMSLDFSDANNAIFSYTVNGFTQSKRIERMQY